MDDNYPAIVLENVAKSIPQEFHKLIVVIGSLAAGYHFFGDDKSRSIRTKDVDCMVIPRVAAVNAGKKITQKLLELGWEPKASEEHPFPANPETSEADLPGIRLYPPGHRGWFLEFLTEPDPDSERNQQWMRIELDDGHAGLASFRYLSLTVFEPLETEFGIRYAQPATMALANLLAHPVIGPETMSSPIGGREIKRSNKDLGRVLAMARLGDEKLGDWPNIWQAALMNKFPDQFKQLVSQVGAGLRELLGSESDLEQATHTCIHGLLVGAPVTPNQLKSTGLRFEQDVLKVFEQLNGE